MTRDKLAIATLATDDDVLTVEEAAALLRVNRKTLYEMIRARTMPGVMRVGRVLRICRTTMLASLQEGQHHAGRK